MRRGAVRPRDAVALTARPLGLVLLGRMAADLRRPLSAGESYIVQAWPVSRDGRKLHTASAIFCAQGTLRAVARAVWIELTAKD